MSSVFFFLENILGLQAHSSAPDLADGQRRR